MAGVLAQQLEVNTEEDTEKVGLQCEGARVKQHEASSKQQLALCLSKLWPLLLFLCPEPQLPGNKVCGLVNGPACWQLFKQGS